MLTVLVDYDSGNLHSAEKAFQRMAAEHDAGEVIVTSDPKDIARADRIVLPGDGAFPACKQQLADHTGQFDAISEAVLNKGRPFMGICVGMQMMATRSLEYQVVDGFGWIAGEVVKISPTDPHMKIPHMGWNELVIDNPHPVMTGLSDGNHAYFVHSYHFRLDNPSQRLAHCDYGGDITAIIGRDNMIGTQFHPEKSQAAGLRLISNFLSWSP
jgi:glutamine amidotransferase